MPIWICCITDAYLVAMPNFRTHILWTDAMNRELIRRHYPFFLETYDSFELNIMRADSARVFYMHRYGGVYMDLDFEVGREECHL